MLLTDQQLNTIAIHNLGLAPADQLFAKAVHILEDYDFVETLPDLDVDGKIQLNDDKTVKTKVVTVVHQKCVGVSGYETELTQVELDAFLGDANVILIATYAELVIQVNDRLATLTALEAASIPVAGLDLQTIAPARELCAYIEYDEDNPDLLTQIVTAAGGTEQELLDIGEAALKALLANTQYSIVLDSNKIQAEFVVDFIAARPHYGRPVFTH